MTNGVKGDDVLRVALVSKTLSPSSHIDTDQSLAECAESAFSKAALCPSESLRRTQNLLAGCIFDGLACQKCFCVTLVKSNRTENGIFRRLEMKINAKNDKCNGRRWLGQS